MLWTLKSCEISAYFHRKATNMRCVPARASEEPLYLIVMEAAKEFSLALFRGEIVTQRNSVIFSVSQSINFTHVI